MSNPIQVALVGRFPRPYGGISLHTSRLKERLENDGFGVHCLCINDPADAIIPVEDSSGLPRLLWSLLRSIRAGTNVFHFHTSKAGLAFIAGAPLLRILRRRIILSIHSGDIVEWLQERSMLARLMSGTMHRADRVIVMNEQARQQLEAMVPSVNVVAISPLVFPVFAVEEEWNSIPRQSSSAYRVVVMGLWQPYYQYEDAVMAIEIAHAETATDYRLEIVASTAGADRSYRNQIAELATERSRPGLDFRLVEDVDDILSFLAKRDLLIRSSSVDSFGLCVSEALMVGTPAIATDVCPRPDRAETYPTGDVSRLAELIVQARAANRIEEKPRRSLLPQGDDSYGMIRDLYSQLVLGS